MFMEADQKLPFDQNHIRTNPRGFFFLVAGVALVLAQCVMEAEGADFQPWGAATGGVRTCLMPVGTNFALGQPMQFRLEMENVGKRTIEYDSQQVAVNESMLIKDSAGKECPFIAPGCQTGGSPAPLEPGKKVVLFEKLDVAEQYLILKPGRYTFQFRGQDKAFGEVDIPLSNVVTTEVANGSVPASREIVNNLIGLGPDALWRVSLVKEGEVTPPLHSAGKGVHLYLVRNARNIADLVVIRIWVMQQPSDVDKASNQATAPAEYLGISPWGSVYIQPDKSAAKHWPDFRKKIVHALKIKSITANPQNEQGE